MSRFADYVTSVGFRLELTKAQLRVFSAIALQTEHRLAFSGGGEISERALVSKGLIEYHEGGRELRLTREGELLVPLLRRAGLLEADTVRITKNLRPTGLMKDLEQ